MSLKLKIKRMLAFMLKDELKELVEVDHVRQLNKFQYVAVSRDFDMLKAEFVIPGHALHDRLEYEEQLARAKEIFFEQVERSIQVDALPLHNERDAYNRYIRLSLMVQKPRT